MKKIYYLIAMAFMAITFTSCENVPDPYGKPVSPIIPYEPAGTGVETDPFNVAGAIEKCKEIGGKASTEKYYIKGYAAENASADGGKIQFTMTDSKEGKGKKFTAYKVAGSDNKNLPSDFAVSIGEEIVLYGPIYYYNNKTPETATGAYIVTVNGEKTGEGGDTPSGEAKGTGTLEDPFNAVAANLEASKLASGTTSDKQYYIKGKVAKIPSNANYGEGKYPTTANYYISDDGEDANTFYIYASKYLGNKDYSEGAVLKVGDEVIVCGNITNYNGTYETAQNKNYLYSLNGENSGGGDTPTETLGTKDNPLTVAKALEYISALEDNAKTDKYAYVKGTIKTIKTKDEDIAKYKNIDYIITDGTNEVTVFRGKNLDNTDFTAAGQINVGDEVVVYGQLTKYVKDGAVTPEVAQGNYLVSLKSSGSGGGGQSSYSINFKTSGQGEWTINDKTKPAEVEKIWQYDSKYGMKASAFASSTNYASESLLISPKFSLEGASKATLTIKHAINFFASVDAAKTEAQVLVSTDGGTNWTALTLNGWPDKLSWTFFESTADFSAYAGKKDLQIALKYSSTADKAGTWEIESVTIE